MEIPRTASQGLVWLLNQAIGVKGTAAGVSTDGSRYAAGATVITINALGTGSIKVGDRVKFGTDTSEYIITVGVANVAAGGSQTITITPPLYQLIPATTDLDPAVAPTITVVTTTDANSVNFGALAHTDSQRWVSRDQFMYHTLQLVNAGSATVKIYASMDPSLGWHEITTVSLTASGIYQLPDGPFGYLKVLRDNTTAGIVTVKLLSVSVTGNQ